MKGSLPARRLCVFLAILAVFLLAARLIPTDRPALRPGEQELHLQTGAGDVRTTTLIDGTVLRLEEGTDARVHITNGKRVIVLSRGEVRVVAKVDGLRPLMFSTQNVVAQTQGSTFVARISAGSGTEITVEQGAAHPVELRFWNLQDVLPPASDHETRRILMREGQNVLIRPAGELVLGEGTFAFGSADLPVEPLVFRDALLADVLARFNRFYKAPARIEDPELEALAIDATFNAYDRPTLIQFLSRAYGVVARPQPDGTVVLARADSGPTHRI